MNVQSIIKNKVRHKELFLTPTQPCLSYEEETLRENIKQLNTKDKKKKEKERKKEEEKRRK